MSLTPSQLRAYRRRRQLSRQALADLTELSVETIRNYERGVRREDGRPIHLPHTFELALAAIELGLNCYDGRELTLKDLPGLSYAPTSLPEDDSDGGNAVLPPAA